MLLLNSTILSHPTKVVTCREYSMQLNASRIRFLQAQDDVVNSMKESASKELLRASSNNKAYKKLLKALIIQVVIVLLLSYAFQDATFSTS